MCMQVSESLVCSLLIAMKLSNHFFHFGSVAKQESPEGGAAGMSSSTSSGGPAAGQ